ncbi:DUF4412 domain-containing protein [Lutimonas zeaxanthinifaciens]|uniref:DUF4412 domain-containing protein n=1 Tax=Lutimonas zeaxanthinifaciens TaxID=3060215 RepID=UPI00265C905A|nr:DUF4412 domain-containing protein [Lutimonas sp. YSD2104]WKK66184.1 DUF4412 domain-containing protein [Lutimonas sp. YSD2104]
MRHLKIIFIFLFISTLTANSLQAQLLKKLKKRVQDATEEVIEERAQEESEQTLDSVMAEDQEIQSDYEQQLQNMMGASSGSVTVEDSYLFDTKVNYLMTIEENGKTSEVNYEMWFPSKESYMATKVLSSNDPSKGEVPTSVLAILDDKNQAMIMIMEEQKMAQMISMEKIKDVSEKENQAEKTETEFESIKSTGKTKTILGYLCEEFESQNETNKISFWVTKELSLYQKNMFLNLSKSLGGNTFNEIPEEAHGLMMEMFFHDSNSNQKGQMKLTSIEPIENKIVISDYQVLSFGQ